MTLRQSLTSAAAELRATKPSIITGGTVWPTEKAIALARNLEAAGATTASTWLWECIDHSYAYFIVLTKTETRKLIAMIEKAALELPE